MNQKNTSTKISNIAEPIKGQEVKLANQNFKIVAVEKFLSLTDAKKIDDFLNDEDKKIIDEIEKEIKNNLTDDEKEHDFDDDPYPESPDTDDNIWDINEDDDIIDIEEEEDDYKDGDTVVLWNDVNDSRETTIAYYRSFHTAGSAFGIYYMRNGLRLKTRLIYDFCISRNYQLDVSQVYVIAKTMTQFHEIYHHKIEAIASRIEVATRKPIYRNGFSRWYIQTRNLPDCYEETFANCYTYFKTKKELKRFLNPNALHNIMIFWFRRQPPPYRRALNLIRLGEDEYRNKESLFFEIILKKLNPGDTNFGNGNSNVWSLFSHGTQPYINVNSNVYYII